jgi:hypothetical protein
MKNQTFLILKVIKQEGSPEEIQKWEIGYKSWAKKTEKQKFNELKKGLLELPGYEQAQLISFEETTVDFYNKIQIK